jgi:hypothetical protein
MSFVVPVLQPHLYGANHFGACKLKAAISDPGGAPGSGIVHLRGAVRPDPMYSPAPNPAGLQLLFTLPVGMRPIADRWLTCQISKYLGLFDSTPSLCLVRSGGQVEVKSTGGVDGAAFLDGVSFVAEQ